MQKPAPTYTTPAEALDTALRCIIDATRMTVEEYRESDIDCDHDSVADCMIEELARKLNEWDGS